MAARYIWPNYRALDNLGAVEPGATLTFYASGTSTPLATYSDDALTIANTNPVVADANGLFGDIFLQDVDYRVVYKDSGGTQFWDEDPVRAQVTNTGAPTFLAADGSAALPSYAFVNAGDTGFYRDTTTGGKAIGVANAGTFTCRFDDNGKLIFEDPQSITGPNSLQAAIQVNGLTGGTSSMSVFRASADTASPQFHFVKSRATAVGSFATVQVGDNLGQIIFGGDDGTTYTDIGARIVSTVTDTTGAIVQSNIKIYTGGNSVKYDFDKDGHLIPIEATANQDLGANLAANAFQDIYTQNAVTVVSDESLKHNPQALSLAEQKACLECAMAIKKYNRIKPADVKYKLDENGNKCFDEDGKPCYETMTQQEKIEDKISIGVVAQEVVAIFQKHGLDAINDYEVIKEMRDGKLMVRYDHIQNGAINALANGVTL